MGRNVSRGERKSRPTATLFQIVWFLLYDKGIDKVYNSLVEGTLGILNINGWEQRMHGHSRLNAGSETHKVIFLNAADQLPNGNLHARQEH